MKRKIKMVEQTEHSECGLACATMILNYEGINISLNEIRDTFGVPRGGISLYHLIQVMTAYGIKCKAYEILDIYSLRTISTPFICLWEKKHYVTVENIRKNKVLILDPAIGRRRISFDEFTQSFSGYILAVDKIEFLYKCNKTKNILLDRIKSFVINKFYVYQNTFQIKRELPHKIKTFEMNPRKSKINRRLRQKSNPTQSP